MISSEVQRTLVKSPPELWAELSDPASLARHLGELGEIRITRAEPEKLVEWEADGASGRIAIKASGWGTKVTLSASRDYTPPAITEPPAGESEAEHPDADPSATVEEVAGVSATAAARFAGEHPAALLGSDLERAAEDTAPAAENVDAAVEDPPADPAAESEPRSAMPSTAEQQISQEEGAAEEPAPEDSEVPAQITAGEEGAGEDGSEAEAAPPPDAAPHAEPEQKLGFFARLFGRGRRRRASVEHPAGPAVEGEAPAPGSALAEVSDPAGEAQAETGEHHELAGEPAAQDGSSEPADEPTQVIAEQAETPEPAAEAQAEPVAEMPSAQADEPEAEDDAPEPQADAPIPAVDLAAELKAAEEAAEAEVHEILKGVLDRLGAAHHRPFSRA